MWTSDIMESMLTQIQDEAIVLQATDCQEDGRIISLFTLHYGLIKLFLQAKGRDGSRQRALSTPLTLLNVSCRANRGDLYRCSDAKIIDQHLELREELDTLESACHIARALQRAQVQHVAAPALYLLLKSYLKLLYNCKSPASLVSSFQLKLLRHEGLLASLSKCPRCLAHETPPITSWGYREFYCSQHSPSPSMSIMPDELTLLHTLARSKSSSVLTEIETSDVLRRKINGIFLELTDSH